jgi:chromosome segregation ATPase
MQPESSSTPVGAAESDPDTTAELPVLDVSAYEARTQARTSNTDTWITPAPAVSEPSTEPPSPALNKAVGVATAVSTDLGEDKPTQLEIDLRTLSDNLREAQERLKRKGERLTEIEQALAHAQAERAAAEQLSQQRTNELTQMRAATAALEARHAELHRTLDQKRVVDRNLPHDLEESLALRDKALALVQRDLTAAQAAAAAYLESLRSLEGRRGIFEHLATSLQWEIDTRDTQLSRAQERLSGTTSSIKDLEATLAERAARIATLEEQIKELHTAVTQREEALRQATVASDDLKQRVGSLTESLAVQTAHNAELETASRAVQHRCEELDAANVIERRRADHLEAELTRVRVELQQRAAALQDASTERGEHMARLAAREARVEDLEGRIVEQREFVKTLRVDSNASVARVKELEGDLRAAEDMIHRLEAELRGRSSRLDELERTHDHWRVTMEEARNALIDRDSLIRRLEEETANSAVLLGAIQQRLDTSAIQEQMPDGDTRLLIRTEGDSEVVHVLGRKTSVGRTTDNDLHIDAKYISRHHAVILAGPAHTIIEDLNSTNGVLVNGRRITRQTLRDGDSVMIGKTMFRFAVRPAMERRA